MLAASLARRFANTTITDDSLLLGTAFEATRMRLGYPAFF